MSAFTVFIIILLGVALLGLGIYLFILIFKEEDERFEDNIIINFMPQFTNPDKGHAIGMEVSTKKIGKRFLLEYSPRDLNKRLLKEKEKLENVKIVVDSNKIISLPTGTMSGFRNVKVLLPPNPEDFPDQMKDTLFGQALMKLTEQINNSNVEAKIIREGSNRKTKLLTELGDGEISEEFLERQKEINRELDKQKQDTKPQPSSPQMFRPPSMVNSP